MPEVLFGFLLLLMVARIAGSCIRLGVVTILAFDWYSRLP